ncbi:hypothetical protein GOARA_027_00510 [Gordonia araii NBRC 100433]|uniref:Uncharacterized protein n=1 Tax=Gordonia araii NBRC 100433 TaxID=1073574 RepID=G7GZR3_9ACTN|nr:hypothetical protein [Gordonia araii]NNG98850.1 hypothetical protein [Gordonia araii NBRC 100433]GAB09088.1 hypothetical protein GOARA_027_00510 [Gordonia araii NBRC 100433]
MHYPKAIGMLGYILILVGIPFIAIWLALAAYAHPDAGWVGVAAVSTLLLGIAALVVSRLVLTSRRDVTERVEEDPIQPEVTAEEAAEYEAHYHGRDVGRE